MMQKFILTALLGAGCMSTWGQTQVNDTTVNRTVVVEQEYNPTIIDADKVNVVPAVPPLTAHKKTVEYDWTLLPASNVTPDTMQAYTQLQKPEKPVLGEARLGYGSHGNLDIWAAYHFLFSERNRLNLCFGMNGRDGKLNLIDGNGKWNSHFYHSKAAADWTHTFKKVDLQVKGDFGLSNFNFMPESASNKQKFTSGAFQVGVLSTDPTLPFHFHVETGLKLFQRQHDLFFDDAQEGIVHLLADASADINEEQRIGVAMQMENVFYQKNDFENYTSLQLNPYFTLQNDDWNIHLGALVNPTFGFGKKFRAAPDVVVQYLPATSYVLYAQATGGKWQNDFRRLEQVSPYGQLGEQLDATYEQLNAAIGFKGSPLPGWWFHLYGGYQNLKNDVIEGTAFTGQNTHNIYIGLETRYNYKNYLYLSAQGTYRNWDTSKEQEKGLWFKPMLEAHVQIGFRPFHPLLINLGYQHITREKVEEIKLDDVSNLYAEVRYELFKNIGIYAHIYNLLNQDYQKHWGCQEAGTNFVGGVQFRF